MNQESENISPKVGVGQLPDDPSLRKLTVIEGISLLILFLIAMPLKYIWEMPIFVQVFGWIHGILFVFLLLMSARYCLKLENRNLAAKVFIILFFSALLPFGWILADKMLFKKQNT